MPNRNIKESIKTSKEIAQLDLLEENIFYRLIVTADDFGRYFADPSLLVSELYPRKLGFVSTDQMEATINHLEQLGLIKTYEVEDERYLYFTKWFKHQYAARAKYSKFPEPNQPSGTCEQSAVTCEQSAVICEQNEKHVPRITINDIRYTNNDTRYTSTPADDGGDDALIADGAKRNEVYDQAESIGLKTTRDFQRADDLCGTYTDDWVLEAIKIAADCDPSKRSWRYIEGILKKWKEKGFVDLSPKPKNKDSPSVDFGGLTPWEKAW